MRALLRPRLTSTPKRTSAGYTQGPALVASGSTERVRDFQRRLHLQSWSETCPKHYCKFARRVSCVPPQQMHQTRVKIVTLACQTYNYLTSNWCRFFCMVHPHFPPIVRAKASNSEAKNFEAGRERIFLYVARLFAQRSSRSQCRWLPVGLQDRRGTALMRALLRASPLTCRRAHGAF